MPSGKSRGKVDPSSRKNNGNSTGNLSSKKSKVVLPRNPKLVRTKVEDDKVSTKSSISKLNKQEIGNIESRLQYVNRLYELDVISAQNKL